MRIIFHPRLLAPNQRLKILVTSAAGGFEVPLQFEKVIVGKRRVVFHAETAVRKICVIEVAVRSDPCVARECDAAQHRVGRDRTLWREREAGVRDRIEEQNFR